MADFTQYRRKQIAELRPYEPAENMISISISDEDRKAGSPKIGDMIARNPKNHADQWLVAAQYFADNFEPAHDRDSKELLACPFCGGEASAKMYGRDMLFKVECNGCGAEMRGFDQCQQDAIDAWNARTTATQPLNNPQMP